MAGETVAKGMRRGPLRNTGPTNLLNGFLHHSFVQVEAPILIRVGDERQRLRWEQLLPGQFLRSLRVFLL